MHLGILFASDLSLFACPAASIIAFNHYTQIYFLIKPTDKSLKKNLLGKIEIQTRKLFNFRLI